MYQHHDDKGQVIDLPVGKVVCVGRNYLDHIQELNNEVPKQPLLFIKPNTALVQVSPEFSIPVGQGECHNELELAVLIGRKLTQASSQEVMQSVWGYGLALDLTLRDVQSQLKAQGHPWERAKAFDESCPVSGFVPAADIAVPQQQSFSLEVNGEIRQRGDTKLMIHSIEALLAEITKHFTLLPGDMVLTGTPKGVAALQPGDKLKMILNSNLHIQSQVRAKP